MATGSWRSRITFWLERTFEGVRFFFFPAGSSSGIYASFLIGIRFPCR